MLQNRYGQLLAARDELATLLRSAAAAAGAQPGEAAAMEE